MRLRVIAVAPGWRAMAGRGEAWSLQAAKVDDRGGIKAWIAVAQGGDRSSLAAAWRRLTGQGLPEGAQ